MILSVWKLHHREWFVFNSSCGPRHCATQCTEVLSRVTPMGWEFPQVEGKFTVLKFSQEASNALNHGVPWKVLEEQLGSLPGVLDIPEEIGSCTVGIVTLQLQWGSFRDQNRVIRLGHWLASGISCKINVTSVKAMQTSLWKELYL